MDTKPTDDNQPIGPVVITATEPAPKHDATVVTNDQNDLSPDHQEMEQNAKRDGVKNLLSTIAILIIAPLIALSLTAFVFQSYEVDGSSMETTLQDKDRLIVYKLPRTIAKITHHAYVPKRGEVVIFTRFDSLEFGSAKSRQLIKRVIALPGETVTVKDGKITVFNTEKPEGFDPDAIAPYGKVITTTSGDFTLTVPKDSIFVCGDNRPGSYDSRAFGPIKLNDVVGRLSLRVYPFNKGQRFSSSLL